MKKIGEVSGASPFFDVTKKVHISVYTPNYKTRKIACRGNKDK